MINAPIAQLSRPLVIAAQAVLTLALAGLLAGCTHNPSQQVLLAHSDYPPDFSLVFFVDSQAGARADPLHRRALYLLSVDRSLRVALGPGVSANLYPPISARLRPAQVAEIYELTRQAGLLSPEARTGPSAQGKTTTYRISVSANDQRIRHTLPAGRSPAVARLLARLASLGGVRSGG